MSRFSARADLGLNAGDHLADMLGLKSTRFEHGEAFGGRAPAQDADVHLSSAPKIHQSSTGLINIDGAGADEGAAVIIHHIDAGITLDLEDRAQRIDRPICGRTSDGAGFQLSADGRTGTVLKVIRLGMGVGGGSDAWDDLSG